MSKTDKENKDVKTPNNEGVGSSGLLDAVHKKLKDFDADEKRYEFIEELVGQYCRHCGTFDGDSLRSCQCCNDE